MMMDIAKRPLIDLEKSWGIGLCAYPNLNPVFVNMLSAILQRKQTKNCKCFFPPREVSVSIALKILTLWIEQKLEPSFQESHCRFLRMGCWTEVLISSVTANQQIIWKLHLSRSCSMFSAIQNRSSEYRLWFAISTMTRNSVKVMAVLKLIWASWAPARRRVV
jgi:hypothetical protein